MPADEARSWEFESVLCLPGEGSAGIILATDWVALCTRPWAGGTTRREDWEMMFEYFALHPRIDLMVDNVDAIKEKLTKGMAGSSVLLGSCGSSFAPLWLRS